MADPTPPESSPCGCAARPAWARIDSDEVMRWPVVEIAEWEELRQCPGCGTFWLQIWPEELETAPILCRPYPKDARRLKEVDRAATMRGYCLARLEEHLGELKEQNMRCKKLDCQRRRLRGTTYCLEHLIAQQFGRHLAMLDRPPDESGAFNIRKS